MTDAPFTVNTLLGLPNKEFTDHVAAAGAESEDKQAMKDHVTKVVRGLQWKAVEGQIRRKSDQLLEVDVMGLIVAAWRQGKVTDQLDEEHKAQGVNAAVPLQDHSIRSEFEPAIEIKFGNFAHRIVLDVLLEIGVTGMILNIENSRIMEIEAGAIAGFGEIKIAHVPILKRAFGPIDLRGKVHLGKGIPLRRTAADPGESETAPATP
jgi:hypothetical protein